MVQTVWGITAILVNRDILEIALHLDELVDSSGKITARMIRDRYPYSPPRLTITLQRALLIEQAEKDRHKHMSIWRLTKKYRLWKEYYYNTHPEANVSHSLHAAKYKGCEDLKKLLKQAEIMNAELLESLSPEQQELLKALPSDPRYAPTVRRLAKRLGRADNCVSRTLRSFEKRGLVSRRTADKSEQNGKVGLVRYCWYRTYPLINGNSVA
jgi:hypothetical protein